MKLSNVGKFLGLFVAATLVIMSAAQAATVTSTIKGAMGATGQGCLQLLTIQVGDGENCMYNGGPVVNTPFISPAQYPAGESTGPFSQEAFYDSIQKATDPVTHAIEEPFNTAFKQQPGDGKIRQVLTGTVTIDDNGTATPADDLISFTVTLKSPLGGDVVRQLGSTNSSAEDKYTSMTQVLAPYKVDSATANGAGGYDYVIGSAGFPTRLIFTDVTADATNDALTNSPCVAPQVPANQLFGDMECDASFQAPFIIDPLRWTPWSSPDSNRPGLSRMEGNIGARTTGTVTNLACVDTGTNNACKLSKVSFAPRVIGPNQTPGGGITAEDVGWDDVYLKVSTDASGKVIAMTGYPVQEYQVFGANVACGSDPPNGTTPNPASCNAWLSEYFDSNGIVADNDGPVTVLEGTFKDIDVLANDRGFKDPVTVTIVSQSNPAKGELVTVSGSPGPAAGIRVRYTAKSNATGADTFTYKVDDGTNNDTATVTVDILSATGAQNDSATTSPNTPVNINVGANDVVAGPTATVTIDNTSFRYNGDDATIPPAHGTAVVTAGNGGPPAGIVVTYTPNATTPPGPGGAKPYTETFIYSIDDGLSVTSAKVSVFLNIVPVAKDGAISISTSGSDPIPIINGTPNALTAIFDAPGAGGSLGNAGLNASVTITSDGTRGTATVIGNEITYTITDPNFYHGTDQYTYLITDNDGETSSGTVTVTIPDLTPTFINFPKIVSDQDHASIALGIPFVVNFGNGSRDVHHPVTITTPAQHGTCAVTPSNGTGGFVYTPNSGYSGPDSCTLTISDVDGQQGSVAADITVNPVLTVTPNPGGAAMDPWTLAAFGALPLLRWRRRRVSPTTSRGRGWQLAALAALLGMSISAFGQETPKKEKDPQEGASTSVGEIVVTSRGFEEKLKDVPLAITAFDAQTIEAAGIQSLGDVADMTPGLSFFNAFGENLPVPVIRGVVPTDIFGQNNAALFVDGIYVAGREGLNFDLVDVERIEVVKGPQSAKYGRNAFSGAINYVSKVPGPDFEAKVNGTFGNAGELKGGLLLSGPILGDTLLGRIAMQYDNFDGTFTNSVPGGNDIGGWLKRSYQGQLFWNPTNDLKARLGYYKSVDRIDDPASVAFPTNCEDLVQPPTGIPTVSGLPNLAPWPGSRLQNYCGEVPGIRATPGLNGGTMIPKIPQATGEQRDLDRINLRIDWDLPDYGSISSLSGFSYTNDSSISDFGRSLGFNQPFLYCQPASVETPGNPNSCFPNGTYSPADKTFFAGTYNIAGGARTSEFSQELRFTSPADKRVRVTGGAYWYKNQVLNRPGNPLIGFPNGQSALSQNTPPFNNPAAGYGFPPFDASAPNFAIGSAIFYGSLTADGGIDPLNRISSKNDTQGWAIFSGIDINITDQLTAHLEGRLNQEHQLNRVLNYTPCVDKSAASVATCGDDYYNLKYADPIYLNASGGCTGLDGNDYATGRCSQIAGARFQLVTGRMGLDYKFENDWMLYGSLAWGEKPGGAQLISATVVCPTGVANPPKGCPSPDGTLPTISPNPFGIESIVAYELGLKGDILDRRIGFDLAAFYNNWRDIVLRQLLNVDPVTGLGFSQPTGFNVNAGDAHVLGTEAELHVRFTDEWRSDLTFGWTDAKITNAVQSTYAQFPTFRANCGVQPSDPNQLRAWWNNCNQISGDVSGNTLLRQPEFKGSAALTYEHPLFGEWDFRARADATYQSSVYIGNDNESWLPSHTYLNTKLTVKSPKYSVDFWVRNLLNNGGAIAAFRDIYWANTSNLYAPYVDQGPRPNFNQFPPLRLTVTYPQERTLGVNVQIRFGAAVK